MEWMKIITLHILFLLIIVSVSHNTSNASTKKTILKEKPQTLKQLENEIRKQQIIVKKTSQKLSNLENKLGDKNSEYLNSQKDKKNVETLLSESKNKIEITTQKLGQLQTRAKHLLADIILNSLSDSMDTEDLLSEQILKTTFKNKLNKIGKVWKNNQHLLHRSKKLDTQLVKILKTEQHLITLLNKLEEDKRTAVDSYLKGTKTVDLLQVKFDNLKTDIYKSKNKKRQKKERNQKIRFSPPLKSYTGLGHTKTRMIYKYKGINPVYATQKGVVSYIGSLSSYGNITIINHGNNTRSIIFGDFGPKIKKGKKVSSNDIIGYTNPNIHKTGKLYFEVRIKNMAQDTILLMDKKSLAENNFIKRNKKM